MGVGDMNNYGFDADASRYDRANRTQQAPFAPGQDQVFQSNTQNIFANSTIPNNQTAIGDIFSAAPAAGNFGAMPGAMPGVAPGGASPNSMTPGMGMPGQGQQKSQEDQLIECAVKFGKATFSFFKDTVTSFSQLTPLWWYKYFYKVTTSGVVVAAIGLVGRLFGILSNFDLVIAGCMSSGVGVVAWAFLFDSKSSVKTLYKDGTNGGVSEQAVPPTPPVSEPVQSNPFDGDMGFSNPQPAFDDTVSMEWDSDSEEGSDWGEDEDDPYGFGDDDWSDTPTETAQPAMSTEEALSSLPDIPRGMYERKYLYDMFTKKLPFMQKDFAKMRVIEEDSDDFLLWGDRLIEAATCAGCKEDYLPELLKLEENIFTIIVTCSRPQNMKVDNVAKELVGIFSYNEDTGQRNGNIFAKADVIGQKCKITIFNGKPAMISLRDMLQQEENFFLDTDNYMPVALGVDLLANVITVDMKKLESIIITGMPRSGKSWFVQAILTQMCAFVPPTELNILICDPKEGVSDFRGFCLPHVKKFVTGDDNIVAALRDLVKREAPRRNKLIGDAGFVNIWEFKEANPNVKIPIVYVLVDEVVTLASRMEKSVNNEFRMLLRELISQLPALGIRAFLIPHVLNDEIIEKKTSDLVPCKVSVCGDADHIEKATGSKPRDFPYKLVNKGDMAVKLLGFQNTIYVHGPALNKTNKENNETFNYLRLVWTKLEPDEVAGSIAEEAAEVKDLETIASQLSADSISSSDDEDFDLFA